VYCYRASKLRIVTEANIYCPDVMDQVVYWAQRLEERLEELCCSKGISLSNDVELFLQLNELEAEHCAYYFIDHGRRTQFWIDDMDIEALGLAPTVPAACIGGFRVECCYTDIINLIYTSACAGGAVLETCRAFPDALDQSHPRPDKQFSLLTFRCSRQ
jgi:hypothetical protein